MINLIIDYSLISLIVAALVKSTHGPHLFSQQKFVGVRLLVTNWILLAQHTRPCSVLFTVHSMPNRKTIICKSSR